MSKISHDARNSVRAILEVPNWIEDDLNAHGIDIPEDVQEHLGLLVRHARRLDQMIQDWVTFCRVGDATGPFVTDLSLLLPATVNKLDIPEGFEVTYDVQIEDVQIPEGDFLVLLTALVSNAIKHHTHLTGHVHVRVAVEDGWYLITVADDGPGIAQADLGRVLKAMTTLRPRDEVEGSGMGLTIASKIIRQYRGTLQLNTDSNATGCQFDVRFPAPAKCP